MADDGETKDDVKVPDGEVGEKIDKLFTTEEKDTSKFATQGKSTCGSCTDCIFTQTSLFLQLWVSRLPLKPRKLPVVRIFQVNTPTTSAFLDSITLVYSSIYSNNKRS